MAGKEKELSIPEKQKDAVHKQKRILKRKDKNSSSENQTHTHLWSDEVPQSDFPSLEKKTSHEETTSLGLVIVTEKPLLVIK